MTLQTPRFLAFVEKRRRWQECLSGPDRHSVRSQLVSVISDAADFRIVNEARRVAPPAPEGGIQVSGLLHNLLNRTFFESQMAAIRRLVDVNELAGARGVFSLRRLVDELRRSASELTREHIFEAEGLHDDYSLLKSKFEDFQAEQVLAGVQSVFVPMDLCWRRHQMRHEQLDRLSGVDAVRRSKADTVRIDVFEYLRRRIDNACGDIGTHVNKFIAHAATPESRASGNADSLTVTLGHLWRAHQTLCEVTGFVSVYILGGPSLHFLPHQMGDQFAYMDRPLITPHDRQHLQQVWKDYEHETRSWASWGIVQVDAEMNPVPMLEQTIQREA